MFGIQLKLLLLHSGQKVFLSNRTESSDTFDGKSWAVDKWWTQALWSEGTSKIPVYNLKKYFSINYKQFCFLEHLTTWDVEMLSERKVACFQAVLPVLHCKDVVLTWHALFWAALSQSVQLPAYIQFSVRLAGGMGSLAAHVSSSQFPALRWDLRAELRIIQGQAHLESLSWLHLPVSELVLMKSRSLPIAHIAWLALVKPIICSS